MIPEIGHFALILALVMAVMQFGLPLFGFLQSHEPRNSRHRNTFIAMVRPLSIGQCLFITIAFICLMIAFVEDDFSVQYVVAHSNSSLPLVYKISAVWGGHEGSLLLWIWMLSLWTLWASLNSRRLSIDFIGTHLAIMGFLASGFLLFLLFTSNPFSRFLPDFPFDGSDLNPLLQDPGLIIHPPILYFGYVGFAIPFAMAIAALMLGKIEIDWLKWLRPFCLVAFGFLTLGVALGSFWAYYELGWGGYWFWDPVENASFMPWLAGIALIHCMIISIKRQQQYSWTLFTAIVCFSLCLFGTFLVRSGVLTSVHAFANDPKRGIWLLQFLLFVVSYAIVLFLLRGPRIFKAQNQNNDHTGINTGTNSGTNSGSLAETSIAPLSRETLLLGASLLLLVAVACIMLGTLYPLFHEAATGKKISVGYPYFNLIFIPLMIPVLFAIPLGPFTRFGDNRLRDIFKPLKWPLILSLIFTVIITLIFAPKILGGEGESLSFLWAIGIFLGLWICLGTIERLIFKLKSKISLSALGMCSAHFGVGILVIGITVVSHLQIERLVKMAPGQSLEIAGYQITFVGIDNEEGSNFVGFKGHFSIQPNQQSSIKHLFPEKRIYAVKGISMTETALDAGFFRDFYIALGEKLDNQAWSVRIYYKPFIRWIWLGGLFMVLGACLAALKRKQFF